LRKIFLDIFELSPENISALALAISIGLAKQYTDDNQLGILAVFFTSIGDNLALIQLQRLTLAEKAKKAEKSNLSESDS